MPAPSRRDVFFSVIMLTLVCPFMYIYTWASVHTTSIFKTSTEVLSIVLHTSSRNTQPCLVCRLKGNTLFSLTCKVKNGEILYALSLTTSRPPPPPHLPVFLGFFWRGIRLCTNFTATAASAGRPPKFVVNQSSRGIDLALLRLDLLEVKCSSLVKYQVPRTHRTQIGSVVPTRKERMHTYCVTLDSSSN